MSANAAKSLANARSPCRGGNRLLWKNDTAANSAEHPDAEAGFWGGTGTTAGESSRRPRRAPAQRRRSTRPRWTLQNRPYEDSAKPGIGGALQRVCCSASARESARGVFG